MMRLLPLLFLFLLAAPAQQSSGTSQEEAAPQEEMTSAEEQALRRGVMAAQGSQVDIQRALERHLEIYPRSKRREEIEFVLYKTAAELGDDARIAKYGQLFLDTGANDIAVFDRVTPLLLRDASEDAARKALAYAKRYEEAAQDLDNNKPASPGLLLSWKKRRDRAYARAYVFQARAQGNLGNHEEALRLAKRAYVIEPTAEAAREQGRWLLRLERLDEAVDRYAEAFVIEDGYNDARHRDDDRKRLGELYRRTHDSEEGLGDRVLGAWDRTRQALAAKKAELSSLAPNADAKLPAEFVLSSLDGEALPISSLKGKVVVVDFWATWCGPCRKQHPLYEQVMQRFQANPDVRFLSVNTDENRDVVRPFLEENQWKQPVHFEDGLAGFLRISSIPTTLILGRDGQIFSRMNGFIPETFVEQLTERVKEALGEARDSSQIAENTPPAAR